MTKVILIFLLLLSCKIFSQDTLTYSSFSKEQYRSWKKTEEQWLKEKFYPFLKKEKIKLSCDKCTSAMLWLVFKNADDKTSYEIVHTKKCAAEFSGKQILELKSLLSEISLSKEFKNKYIKVSLGSSLKC